MSLVISDLKRDATYGRRENIENTAKAAAEAESERADEVVNINL